MFWYALQPKPKHVAPKLPSARAVLDRHGADAYVHALEERLGSEAVADVRLDEETAAALRARDSAAFYGV